MRRPSKTTRRTAATASAALALALGATACGNTTGPESSGELSGQTVTVTGVWTGSEQQNFKKVLDAFSEKTGAKTVFVPSGDNVSTFVGSKIEGGNAPDVVLVPQVGVLQQFAKEGWLQPLSEQTTRKAGSSLAPVWRNYGTVDGTYYGLYFKAAHKSTVWYAPEAFAQAGVNEPTSYADLLKAGRTLADSGRPAFAIAGEDGWTLTDWFENIYLSQAGPEKYDQLAQHKLKWTDDSVVKALTTLGELFKDKQLVAGGAQTALSTDFPTSVAQVFGPGPKAAMVYEGDFVGGIAKDQFGKKPGKDAKFFPFPAVDGGKAPVVSGGDAAVVLKDAKNGKAGMKLLEFLSSPEAAEVWARAGGFLSPNKELDITAYGDETTRSTADSLIAAGDSIRFDMSDQAPAAFGGTKGAGEWKLLQDFLRDPSDPRGTAAKLEAEAAKAYGN
ncbi:sugar ABC transporter substrate-binding protein [Streptomyces nojiriensis]|uniref:Sugar ABC transporter substrate-binding protein n=1 Tax=Streptomyces nojiriensis TaxID=66374 RepID=A0ABQ3SM23_9ACTN|nr:ABC transporter substrate-binding protein [Streptomyces nojiriensis]QTI42756.1 Multiple sugar-binding protein [Streptomyces nojiriensis]GGS16612.1 sugar ABC transporter substrate-binding protein [Streptomyces nojiriensis]GHI69177.1 sugar ABC transporter substrate-binding protein [Streptomyces nojiriensis]